MEPPNFISLLSEINATLPIIIKENYDNLLHEPILEFKGSLQGLKNNIEACNASNKSSDKVKGRLWSCYRVFIVPILFAAMLIKILIAILMILLLSIIALLAIVVLGFLALVVFSLGLIMSAIEMICSIPRLNLNYSYEDLLVMGRSQ